MGSTSVKDRPFTIRTFRPGDLGYIVHRHGILYHQEYKWGLRFEAVAARIVAEFVENYEPSKECCWIAESKDNGQFLGCVMIIKDPDSADPATTAKLRLLLVEPQSRQLGLGSALIQQCTMFAREAGYSRINLWTQSTLVSARRLYAREGYKLVKSEEHASFGIPMTGENWELEL